MPERKPRARKKDDVVVELVQAEHNSIQTAKTMKRTSQPAATPEAREQQLINKAVALAEKQLDDGTASAAVITHYLKLATTRERLEREILANQSNLIKAKTEGIAKEKEHEATVKEALAALQSYSPTQ